MLRTSRVITLLKITNSPTKLYSNLLYSLREFSMSASNKKLIEIDIISDTVCPWCYVGKKRLETAMKQTSDRFDFKVKWHPFFLDPTLPQEGVNKVEHYKRKFGPNVMSMLNRMKGVGEKEGIAFSYGGKIANTMDSHRLIEFAAKQGKQDEMVNVLFKYYFEQEKNIGDVEVLSEAAKEAGLDQEKARDLLKSSEGKDEVERHVEKAQTEFGVSGVPFFIFNNKFSFSGAQDPNTFVSVFNKVAQ